MAWKIVIGESYENIHTVKAELPTSEYMNSSTHRNIQHLDHNLKKDDWKWLKTTFDRGTNCGVDRSTVLSTSRSVCHFAIHSHNICSHFRIHFPLQWSEERIRKNSGRLPHDQSADTVTKLRAKPPKNRGSIPWTAKRFLCLPINSDHNWRVCLPSSGYPGLFPRG